MVLHCMRRLSSVQTGADLFAVMPPVSTSTIIATRKSL